MLLHLLNRGLGFRSLLEKCADLSGPDDCLVLIEDGVYWSINSKIEKMFEHEPKIFAVKEDLEARGLLERAGSIVSIIDYEELVDLTEKYPRSVSWF